jgi:hypothetical protein
MGNYLQFQFWWGVGSKSSTVPEFSGSASADGKIIADLKHWFQIFHYY